MTRAWWISVALLALLAPTAAATYRGVDLDVRAKADLQVEAQADAGYRYTWDWGDGETSVGARARHAYERPGVYKVVVVAVDDAGREHRLTREIEVRAERPSAGYVIDVETEDGAVRVEAEFEARARYEWDWGDGHRARGRQAAHAYAEPGTYEVALKITHADGSRTDERRTVVIRHAADAEVRSESRARPAGLSVSLGVGHDHGDDDDDRHARSRRDRYEGRSEASVSSSSSSYNSVPGVGAPMLGAVLAGAAVVVRAFRRG